MYDDVTKAVTRRGVRVMRSERRKDSLASSMALLTLVMVAVSVTLISVAALVGVFDLANRQSAAAQVAYRQAAATAVRTQLDGAANTVRRASRVLGSQPAGELNRVALAAQYDAGVQYVETLIVARPDGAVIGAWPAFQAPRSIAGAEYLLGITDDAPRFTLAADGTDQVWGAQRASTAAGDVLVVVRVRTDILDRFVDEFSSAAAGRVVYVADENGRVFVSSSIGPRLDEPTLVYGSPEVRGGEAVVSGLTVTGEVMSGRYADITEYPGLSWHVTVLEPRAALLASTSRALLPATLALLVSGLFSVVIAFVFARRLVAPLRELEAWGRDAVAGAYVKHIDTGGRGDEVGRLSDAFNAIGLRLNALHDLSQLLASSSNLDQVLDGIVSAMGHIVGSASVAVYLLDDEDGSFVLARARGVELEQGSRFAAEDAQWLTSVLDAGGPVSVAGGGELRMRLEGGAPAVAGLATPLAAGAEVLGVIAVVRDDDREFSQGEAEMLRTFSAQAAVAVNNSRLFEIETLSRRDAEALREVAERLATPQEIESSFEGVMTLARELLGVKDARIVFLDRASLALPPSTEPAAERRIISLWETAWRAADGSTVVTVQPGGDSRMDAYLRDISAGGVLFLTVVREGEPGAVVMLASPEGARPFSRRDQALACTLGNELSLALDNAYYFAQATSRAVNLETVFRISQAVSSSLQIKVVLNRVLDVVQKIFSADAVALMQYDDVKRRIVTAMARGLISSDILHFECSPGADVPGAVFQSGQPVKIDSISPDSGELAAAAIEQGLHSLLSVPLIARGRSLGVLTVFSTGTETYTSEDMGLLHTFASQAALAIDTADLYGREHHVASVLQASIVPQSLPVLPEIEATSVYLPAGAEAEIGGDYFDLFRGPDGRIVFAIGDVCGKGIEAATKTSMLKYAVRGLVAAGLETDRVMTEVNKMVSESGKTSDIVTLWLGMLDAESGEIVYANGGHPPALLRNSGGPEFERLETTGPLLGALPEAVYTSSRTTVRPGDMVILYTDGVVEARRGNKFFGEGRVRRALSSGRTTAQVVDRLLGSLDRFVPGSMRDDAAVLAIRVLGVEPRPKSED